MNDLIRNNDDIGLGFLMPREKTERIIPLAPIDRLIRKAKAGRVSEKAAIAMGGILEELGLEIALMARDLAEHAHRKTVNGDDIKLAYKQWRRKI